MDVNVSSFLGSMRKESAPVTFSDSLDEAGEDKGQVVAGMESMPERAGGESDEAGAEAGLLPPRRHAQINIVSQPVVGVHIPTGKVASRVLSELNTPRVDVL